MSSTIHQGLILTSHINDKSSGMEISFYGRRQNGQPFKLVFENQKFVFFISHLAIFEPSGIEFQRKPGNLKDFSHRPVDAVYLERFSDVQKVKDYCEVKSLQTFELDIAPAERFLMERFINGKVEFIGKEISSSTLDTFINPQIRPLTDSHIELALLSLDIETGVKGELYSIGLHFTHKQIEHKYVLMLSDENRVDSDWLEFFDSESKLIKSFLNLTAKWDPDINCGWHVIGFDLIFLERKCNKLGIELKLGREDRKINLIERKGAGFFANIPGRIVLDGPPILRGAFYTFKNFKLETVAQAVLGLGKDIASDAGKGSEIERRFKEDKLGLAKYNLLDCSLVLDIFEKLGIVDMLLKRVQISGLLIDRLAMSTAAFDHVYLPRLHRKGYIAPNRIDISRDDSSAGGMVIEPKAGLHKDIAIFDFKSLYPSIIMSFKIDPLSKIMFDTDTIENPV
jgi:DNA polymerase-2